MKLEDIDFESLMKRTEGLGGLHFKNWLICEWVKDQDSLENTSVTELVIRYDKYVSETKERI